MSKPNFRKEDSEYLDNLANSQISEENDPNKKLVRKYPKVSEKLEARHINENFVGLFASENIKFGEIVYSLVLENSELGKIMTEDKSYKPECDCLDRGILFDLIVFCPEKETHPLYVTNHSCSSNLALKNFGLPEFNKQTNKYQINFYATKNIKKGDEILLDYSLITGAGEGSADGAEYQIEKCLCGQKNCRGRVQSFHFLPEGLKKRAFNSGTVSAYIVVQEMNANPEFKKYVLDKTPLLKHLEKAFFSMKYLTTLLN